MIYHNIFHHEFWTVNNFAEKTYVLNIHNINLTSELFTSNIYFPSLNFSEESMDHFLGKNISLESILAILFFAYFARINLVRTLKGLSVINFRCCCQGYLLQGDLNLTFQSMQVNLSNLFNVWTNKIIHYHILSKKT